MFQVFTSKDEAYAEFHFLSPQQKRHAALYQEREHGGKYTYYLVSGRKNHEKCFSMDCLTP